MAALIEYVAPRIMDKFIRENPAYTYSSSTRQWGESISVEVKRNGYPCASFGLSNFPGHSNAIISTHAFVHPQFRGFGIGQMLHKVRLEIAKECPVETMFCTVNKGNDTQLHILKKHGWNKVGDMDTASELWAVRV